MTTFDEVINFYKQFNRYKTNTYEELYNHIIQSINYNQYKIFKDKGVYGFTNWAFVNTTPSAYSIISSDNVIDAGG